MIERYIYQVVKRLPKSDRQEIEKELHSLILDMLEERGERSDPSQTDVEEVLLELGPPEKLVYKYMQEHKSVLSPPFDDLFSRLMQFILIPGFIVLVVMFVLNMMLDPTKIIDHFVHFLISILTTLPMIIGWLMIVLFISFYFSQREALEESDYDKWNPNKLPYAPRSKQKVNQTEAITSIVFYTFFLMIIIFSHDYLGIWLFKRDKFTGIVPFFNEQVYAIPLLTIGLIFSFGILKEGLKLFYEQWTKIIASFTVIGNLISIGLVIFVVVKGYLWNSNFMNSLVQNNILIKDSEAYETVNILWSQFTFWIIILLIIGLLWEMIMSVMRANRNVTDR